MNRIRLLLLVVALPLLIACTLGSANRDSVVPEAFRTAQPGWRSPLPDDIAENIRAIYQQGIRNGNQPMAFSKIGDSITVSRNFLAPFGEGFYDLAEYAHLQPIIDYFNMTPVSTAGTSFNNPSLAAGTGWAAWGAFHANFADSIMCGRFETPLACEYRLVRPSFAVIMFGTNDVGYRSRADFRADMERIITESTSAGVVPILTTMPPRPDVANDVIAFNFIIITLAAEYNLPYIDYYDAMLDLPNFGLGTDNIHPSSPPNGFRDAGNFNGSNLNYGYVMRNLVTLEMLDMVVRTALGQ